MKTNLNRRSFIRESAIATGAIWTVPNLAFSSSKKELFKISLAEWSVNELIFGKARELGWEKFTHMLNNDFDSIEKGAAMKNIEFPAYARSLGIDAVEYVNTCFFDKAKNQAYLRDLKKACDDEGVKSLLIMCDSEGMVGAPAREERLQTLENHKKWIDAAAFLGCHSVRVNAGSQGSYEEQQKLAADGLRLLCEYGDQAKINILVENHGGFSSDAQWLSGVMKMTDHSRVGTLPDFANFRISYDPEKWYDRYRGVAELMPFAKAVSAKSYDFDEFGHVIETDYYQMIEIVLEAGYRGYIGIEYEGSKLAPREGVLATKQLLEKVRDEYADKS
ncbi:sugar phosphate isomerase/epimerase family protein [Gaoshiqia sp. Z1-71]|uniref:sugar phosphate isomerase/epimerase family protein n=1 Tax=Gaoshiqia hydrogeniformans TaxID=3290090 RepID=UPI003BF81801